MNAADIELPEGFARSSGKDSYTVGEITADAFAP